MRHAKAKNRLNRFTSFRRATIISMARNLLIHQRIRTTKAKAKAASPLVEKLISLGKNNSLAAKRYAYKILGEHRLVSFLFSDIAPRFSNRNGGYTRILNLGTRRGDSAKLVLFELTEIKEKEKKPKKAKPEAEIKPGTEIKEAPVEAHKPKTEAAVKEKPTAKQKPTKKFLGGLRGIFKKERDSL
ncbi:MAG: 50S ribosomal protein L17 [Candidatus Omnitrophica bacterium]|nr:50S ribosomal protein L17 [Candidatus Omnitrophota bacterium]